MWGLPAAAIAIWHSARPENRARVGGIMVSAALTSFLTGITEPIEFAFLFVAPVLYLHPRAARRRRRSCCSTCSARTSASPSRRASSTTSLYYGLDTRPWLVLVVGPVYALIYYGVFRFFIERLNLMTPGREREDAAATAAAAGVGSGDSLTHS